MFLEQNPGKLRVWDKMDGNDRQGKQSGTSDQHESGSVTKEDIEWGEVGIKGGHKLERIVWSQERGGEDGDDQPNFIQDATAGRIPWIFQLCYALKVKYLDVFLSFFGDHCF